MYLGIVHQDNPQELWYLDQLLKLVFGLVVSSYIYKL